jgi:hypothetical protein
MTVNYIVRAALAFGKGEVVSSILPGSTIKCLAISMLKCNTLRGSIGL